MNLFKNASILIIGDLMLDKYWEGSVHRVSPEAPVPVVNIQKESFVLGGAANVAHNIASLEGTAHLIGFCGKDAAAESLHQALDKAHIRHDLIPHEHPTIVKLRVLAQHQQLIRLDFEKNYQQLPPISGKKMATSPQHYADLMQKTLKNSLKNHPEINALILSDYGKGSLHPIQDLIQIAQEKKIPVMIDPKGSDFSKYRGAYLVTPNFAEFIAVVGSCEQTEDNDSESIVIQKAKKLLAETGIQNLLLTRSADGMMLIEQNGDVTYQPALAKEVFDVTGAGDTVIAVAGLAIAAGYDLKNAMHLANAAASVVVSKLGTATLTPEELLRALESEGTQKTSDLKTGVLSREALVTAVNQAKALGHKIVFTNGCFDLLHMGHVEYLKQAKSLGQRLIVAVNTDASVKKNKGPSRPILPEAERMNLLAALSCVDWVVSFDEDTPKALLQLIKPDILVKGGDYDEAGIVGHEIVKAYGGKVYPLKLIPGRSTTQIIEKIEKIENTSRTDTHTKQPKEAKKRNP
jgi:D-beta-D-heptose 7-phosphate kinase/D-beta-D-heptose 1-phosphate adenosyltransferase